MRISMKSRKELTRTVACRYRTASRPEKAVILDEFVASTGYVRSYAATLLRTYGKTIKAQSIHTESNLVPSKRKQKGRGGRPRKYTQEVATEVEQLWRLFGHLCGKRLAQVIRVTLPALSAHEDFLKCSPDVLDSLKTISAATIDRMLTSARASLVGKGTCYTRGSKALSEQIPIRTFGEWQDVPPGHFQMDLVGHDGGITTGQCCFTLTMTDVCLGWTERRAVLNRAARWVLLALQDMQEDVPFEIEELHPDNGSEFINQTLVRYCKEMAIALTRSRASRKNDNCYVEQKNFDAVRKLVGYARFTTPETVDLLNTLYKAQGILQNYIYPSQKLIEKTRRGSKVTKHYDEPQSPAQRALSNPLIPEKVKTIIRVKLSQIDPIEIAMEVKRLQACLYQMAERQYSEAYPEGASAG